MWILIVKEETHDPFAKLILAMIRPLVPLVNVSVSAKHGIVA